MDRLAQTDPISQRQPHTAHANAPQDRHQLVQFEPQAAGLDDQQCIWPQGLFQQKRLMVYQPVDQRCRAIRPQFVDDRQNRLERGEDVQFLA